MNVYRGGRLLGFCFLLFADRFMASTACCLFEFLDNLLSAHGYEWLQGWQNLDLFWPGNALIIGHFIFTHCSQQQWLVEQQRGCPRKCEKLDEAVCPFDYTMPIFFFSQCFVIMASRKH